MEWTRRFLSLALAAPICAYALSPGTGQPDPVPPDYEGVACSGNQLQPGESVRSVEVGGTIRRYTLHVPASYDGSVEVPLLLDFHPLNSGSDYQKNTSGTVEVADREGFLVAYPQGIDGSWNFGPCCTESRTVDDVAFARAVVDDIRGEGCVIEKRVYATGYSNGGGLAYKLACDAADQFAAVAPAAFDMTEEMSCSPSRPVSVFVARGRLDFIVPYRGGRSTPPTSYPMEPITFLGAEGSFSQWGELNACPSGPGRLSSQCEQYSGCDAGTEVVLCTSSGGHSAWNAQDSWNFLKAHELP